MGLTLGHQPIHEGAACADGITPSPLRLQISDNVKLPQKCTSAPAPLWLLVADSMIQEFIFPIPTEKQNPHTPSLSGAQIKGLGQFRIQEQLPATKGKPSKAENKMCRFQGLKNLEIQSIITWAGESDLR